MNVLEEFKSVTGYATPRIISEVNDQYVKIGKIQGEEVPWHNHQEEDELFYIVEGKLLLELEGQAPFPMHEGDLFVVPKGKEHRISATEECKFMLVEAKSTKHTGDVKSSITKTVEEQKY